MGDDGKVANKGEAHLTSVKLGGVGSLAFGVSNSGRAHDLNVASTSSVPASHLRVHLADRTVKCCLPVLLVHVVDTRARVVTEPYSKVLHLVGLLLVDLLN